MSPRLEFAADERSEGDEWSERGENGDPATTAEAVAIAEIADALDIGDAGAAAPDTDAAVGDARAASGTAGSTTCPRCGGAIAVVASHGPLTHRAEPCGCRVPADTLKGVRDNSR